MNRLLIFFLMTVAPVVNSQTTQQIGQSEIGVAGVVSDEKAFIKAWGISQREYKSYSEYMGTTGKYFYQNLDPLMVLGFIAKTPLEKQQLAERQLLAERARFKAELDFIYHISLAQKRIFPDEKLVNLNKLPAYQAYKQSKSQRGLAKNPTRKRDTSGAALTAASSIITMDYLIEKDCGCVKKIESVIAKLPASTIINLYARPSAISTLDQIKNEINDRHPSRIVTAKEFDSIVYSDVVNPKKAIVRRDGEIFIELDL